MRKYTFNGTRSSLEHAEVMARAYLVDPIEFVSVSMLAEPPPATKDRHEPQNP